MENKISIDIGYSATKVQYKDKIVKFPTAISYATDLGTEYGEENVYKFEDELYHIGKEAVSEESFSTTEYKFLNKFAPVIIYHVLSKFKEVNLQQPIEIRTGLALVDWGNKESFQERISNIEVNDEIIKTNPIIIPQGAGCAVDWVSSNNNSEYPDILTVVDIGFNTINFLSFEEGKPVKQKMKSYPGHGVSSILKPFTTYMENTYKLAFSTQEAIKIFTKGSFTFNGTPQEQVQEKIKELKTQFVKKLFNSVLVDDKKTLALSEVVLLAGGGCYLLEDIPFPPNVKFVDAPYEFSNVRGYSL